MNRCKFCGLPLVKRRDLRDKVCAEHRPLLAVDQTTALEIALSTTGAATGSIGPRPKEVRR